MTLQYIKKVAKKGFHTLFTMFGTVKTAPAPFLIIENNNAHTEKYQMRQPEI